MNGHIPMQRVAVFGNAGGGKSTLARRLAALTRLPLHVVDRMQWQAGGGAVPHEDYLRAHAELLRQDLVRAKMEREVREKFAGLASFETPKKIALLEHDFSIERGELTPKLSVKRRVIDQTYKDVIDALYAESAPGD